MPTAEVREIDPSDLDVYSPFTFAEFCLAQALGNAIPLRETDRMIRWRTDVELSQAEIGSRTSPLRREPRASSIRARWANAAARKKWTNGAMFRLVSIDRLNQ